MRNSQRAFTAAVEPVKGSAPRSRTGTGARAKSSASHRRGNVAGERPDLTLRIGEVARRAGVGIDALRFYEREGLIARPARDPSSGYRAYSADVVRTVRFIQEAQALGFTLKETAELLRLSNDRTTSCSDVRKAAQSKLTDIERRIGRLQGMRAALRSLVDTCGDDGSERACPILAALLDGPEPSPKRTGRSAKGQRHRGSD